jgi:hypothetical protein
MSRLRNVFIALVVTFAFGTGRSAADDTVLLKGEATNAALSNLKGTAATDADTIPVFHGRLLACFFPCLRGAAYYAPAPVYYGGCFGGCTGCFGGGYVSPVSYGYSAPTPTYASPSAYAFAAPIAPRYAPLPAYAYTAPTQSLYPPEPPRAVVTLPRFGLSFSVGAGNGLLASRSTMGNRLSAPTTPVPESRSLPPVEARPDQFRYDGGPATPIPTPRGNTQPLPSVDPGAPALNNRAKLAPSRPTWLAYGDRPKAAVPPSSTLLVKEGHR